jgi:hypothetical protein
MVGATRMILVIVLVCRDLALAMAMIFSGLLVLLWTREKSAHRRAADSKKPSGINDGENRDPHDELMMTSQP